MQDRELLGRILWQVEDNRRSIGALHGTLEFICKELGIMSGSQNAIDQGVVALQAQVTQQTTVEASAVTLLNGLAQQLNAALAADNINPQDAPNLQAAIAALQTSQQGLAAAITANTPAQGQAQSPANPQTQVSNPAIATAPGAVAPPGTVSPAN